ncbi:MAG: CRISPR-associated helicase Cas3' [Candidatus Competibacteraceae bacterium]
MSGEETKELLSHYEPSLRLKEHVAQVNAAAQFVLAAHSPPLRRRRMETTAVLDALVRCHDLGKGSPAFQSYISNPKRYRGPLRAKEHSALSAALAIQWARAHGWSPLQTLALAQASAGHHAGFATLEHLEERLLTDDDDVLGEQWAGLSLIGLARATGLELATPAGKFEANHDWLFEDQEIADCLQSLALPEAVQFRLWTQFLFSILLEADKAFLALREEKLDRYFKSARPVLSPGWVDEYLTGLPETPVNPLRRQIREHILDQLGDDRRCCTLTLPTGVGKTLLAASWALQLREQMAEVASGSPPKIIIVLPYLSIIDQTEQEYRKLFRLDRENKAQSEWLMASHSLSQPQYELEGEQLGQRYTYFFLDTWRSEVILTTFDQLLLALFSDKTRHLMRFHQLMDALIILDEVQTLPCRLWDLVDHTLRALTEEGNSRILLMSATLPALLTDARELAGDAHRVGEIFAAFKRYRITFLHRQEQELEAFIAALCPRLDNWLAAGKRVLITLNTRASAKAVWRALADHIQDLPIYLISADVTPLDRLARIAAIKSGEPCVVVSTQTVEAGVDIDMDIAIRDFAPLDALIQVAGRCNRNNRRGEHGGKVEVISLLSTKGKRYAEMIYDLDLLSITHQTLENVEAVGEEGVLALSRRYFALVKERKSIGKEITQAFANWKQIPDIHALLRGEKRKQVAFLVLSTEDQALRNRIEQAIEHEDHWERRNALRLVAAEIQQRTVSVYARPGFEPTDYADPLGPFWILRERYYHPESGLDLQVEEDNPVCIF